MVLFFGYSFSFEVESYIHVGTDKNVNLGDLVTFQGLGVV